MKKRNCVYLCFFIIAAVWNSSFAIKSLENILVGGVYRMVLLTGDDLEGTVYSKTDSSIVLDCKGKPYTFVAGLISEYRLIAEPSAKKNDSASLPVAESFTYEGLMVSQPIGMMLDVRMRSGQTFRGSLVSIDNEFIKLNVDKSTIPIAQTVVERIMSVPVVRASAEAEAVKPRPPAVLDTLIVKNTETDSLGRSFDNKILAGKIMSEDNNGISFLTVDKNRQNFPFDEIVRVIRHTAENPETERIRRYALPLICPPGMMLVDVPPGKANRPFFKICIDKYEYPNKPGVVPQVNVSFSNAQKLCEEQGKRLCMAEEWQWACSGIEGLSYSYGWNFDKTVCNTDTRVPEASGSRNKCVGKFGAADMTGNVFEWVNVDAGIPAAMGGPLSKCQTLSPGESGDAKPQTGFRCCKSN